MLTESPGMTLDTWMWGKQADAPMCALYNTCFRDLLYFWVHRTSKHTAHIPGNNSLVLKKNDGESRHHFSGVITMRSLTEAQCDKLGRSASPCLLKSDYNSSWKNRILRSQLSQTSIKSVLRFVVNPEKPEKNMADTWLPEPCSTSLFCEDFSSSSSSCLSMLHSNTRAPAPESREASSTPHWGQDFSLGNESVNRTPQSHVATDIHVSGFSPWGEGDVKAVLKKHPRAGRRNPVGITDNWSRVLNLPVTQDFCSKLEV